MGKKKADIKYAFEHGEVINYTVDGVSIYPFTKKRYTRVLPNSVAREVGNLSAISQRPMVTLKQLEFNGCDKRTRRMDQQHFSYSTILT